MRHGLNLPAYTPAFLANAITVPDLPLLIAEGGAALEEDLGVKSRLHRLQMVRAIRRLLLGAGTLPAAVENVACVERPGAHQPCSWA